MCEKDGNILKIGEAIENAGLSYKNSTSVFNPAIGSNYATEQNVLFRTICSLLHKFDNSDVFLEVPFSDGVKNNLHFDALVFNSEIEIIIEAKRCFSVQSAMLIAKDIKRISTGRSDMFKGMYQDEENSRKKYGLVVAETRNDQLKNWWCDRNFKYKYRNNQVHKLDDSTFDKSWKYDARDIGFKLNKKDVYWLYGIAGFDIT